MILNYRLQTTVPLLTTLFLSLVDLHFYEIQLNSASLHEADLIINESSVRTTDLLFSCVQLFATPGTAAGQASLSFTISQSLLKLLSIESVIAFNHLILCRPLLLLPSIFPSFGFFSNEMTLCIRWPKYWCFTFSISPSNVYSGLISFRIDWFDLLAV